MCDRWKELAGQMRNGIYFVKRGAILWPSFSFTDHKGGIALMLDDGNLLRTQRNRGMKPARCSMEMFRRMESTPEAPEIDDGLMDELLDDAEWLLKELMKSRTSADDPVVYRIDENSVRFVEAHDTELKVQGIVVTFNLEY
jgi:hypothetical protein